MKRILSLAALVFVAVIACPLPADADVWDWLQELNGPGPSNGRRLVLLPNYLVNIFCSDSAPSEFTGRIFQLPKDPASGTCLFFDLRGFESEADAQFYPVDTTIAEIGQSVRLHPAVELGAGVGWMTFHSKNELTKEEFDGTRLTISFPRLVFKPLLAAPVAALRRNPNLGFFQVYFRETIIVGDLSNSDFAVKPGTVFSRRHQRVRSMGFIIDIPTALRLARVLR